MSSSSPVSFGESLWTSIFVPGTTPTLLLATNASLAALQVVLLALLLATQSLHFFFLSMISAGLWISINWFVKEADLLSTQDEKNRISTGEDTTTATTTATTTTNTTEKVTGASGDTTTEGEARARGDGAKKAAELDGEQRAEKDLQDTPQTTRPAPTTQATFPRKPPGAFPVSDDSDSTSQRATSPSPNRRESEAVGGQSSSEDSEWEKVEQEEAT